jgi:hypothetical protein
MSTPTHYAIALDIGRQRREQIAASFAASRRRMPRARRYWQRPSFPRRRASAALPTAAATSRSAATA